MRYVVAVAETANFTRAAERCHVVQSALSHQIARLERELGVQLFARTSRRVSLTPSGEAFLPAARASIEAANRAAADAAAADGRVRGRLAVGVITTVSAVDIPATLQRFRDAHPRVSVSLRTASSDELAAAVIDGTIDVAFVGLADGVLPPRRVRSRVLSHDRLAAVVAPAHPMARDEATDLALLAQQTFVDFPAGTPGRAQSDNAFATAGLTREVSYEITAADMMIDIVRQNLGVGMLTPASASRYEGVVIVPITDGPYRTEYLLWHDFNPSPAARAYLALL